MKFISSTITALVALLLVSSAPAGAATTKLKNDLRVTGNLTVDGTTSFSGASSPASLAVTNNATIGGTLTVTGATTLTTPLTAANIQSGSAKRELMTVSLSPSTGANADSTVYRGMVFPSRAGTVTRVMIGCQTPPTVGTDVIKVLKGNSSGNTLLSTATFDANTLVANQGTAMTLTATGADLAITANGANSGIYCEYSAGVQTVDAIGITVTIEYEPTDF